MAGTNVAQIAVRRSGTGWIVSGCATGDYELRGRLSRAAPASPRAACRSRRAVRLPLRLPRGRRLRAVRVRVSGARPRRVVVRGGRVVIVDLRGTRRARVVVRIAGRLGDGRRHAERRVIHTCVPRGRGR